MARQRAPVSNSRVVTPVSRRLGPQFLEPDRKVFPLLQVLATATGAACRTLLERCINGRFAPPPDGQAVRACK